MCSFLNVLIKSLSQLHGCLDFYICQLIRFLDDWFSKLRSLVLQLIKYLVGRSS
jgi:hypothetical protein